MVDAPVSAQQLLRAARMFEMNGDAISAIFTYREVILAGEPVTAARARQRVEALARLAWPERPA